MKKQRIIAIIIFIVMLFSGIFLTKVGIDTTKNKKEEIQENINNENIKELEEQMASLLKEETNLKEELKTEKDNNKKTELNNKLNKNKEDKTEVEFEISKIKNGYYDNRAGLNESLFSGLIYMIPGVVLCITSFLVLLLKLKTSK